MAEFVEARVRATGKTQMVPADWIDDEVLGGPFELVVREAPEVVAPEPPAPPPDVQTVAGTETDESPYPAVRAAAAAALAAAVPTEDDTHKVTDAYAAKAGVDLGDAKTKAEKVAAIESHLNAGGTESPTEPPATGEEE